MSVAEARYRIQNLKRRYLLLRALEIILYASAGFLLVFALTGLFTVSLIWKFSLSSVIVLIVIAQQAWHYKLFSLSHTVFIQYLNSHYLQLEESADLFMQAETALNLLQQLQLEKTLNNFNSLYPQIRLPNSLVRSFVIFVVGALFYFGLTAFVPKPILNRKIAGNSPLELIKGIEVIKDQAPKITIDNLNQFTRISFSDKLIVPVKSTLRDDYGLVGRIDYCNREQGKWGVCKV
ncbi:MAG: hypothetical protein IPJ20_03875 [Flammeovirgaceae bacterium]|nr:hypothetical protein [Flammeovirgaceae bacterium]